MNGISISCDLTALDADQRAKRERLFGSLRGRAEKVDETDEGYRLHFPTGAGVWMTAAELVFLERRCCPFLRFRLSVDESGRVTLMLGGGEGVKGFLAGELGLPAGPVSGPARKPVIAALFAPVAAAATALFCCVGPLLLTAAGIASAGLGIAVSRYRLFFAAATVLLAAVGYFVLYRPGSQQSQDAADEAPSAGLHRLFWVGVGVSLAAVAVSLVV